MLHYEDMKKFRRIFLAALPPPTFKYTMQFRSLFMFTYQGICNYMYHV